MPTYRQLKQQIADLEKKATSAMKQEAGKVIETIRRQIAEFGLSAADLGLEVARRAGAAASRTKKRVLAPKYRDPATGKTWNGHGKRPRWIVAAQDKGKIEELLIAKPARAAAAKPAGKKRAKAAPVARPAAKRAAKKAAKKPAAPAQKKRAAAPKAGVKKPAKKASIAATPAASPAAPETAAVAS